MPVQITLNTLNLLDEDGTLIEKIDYFIDDNGVYWVHQGQFKFEDATELFEFFLEESTEQEPEVLPVVDEEPLPPPLPDKEPSTSFNRLLVIDGVIVDPNVSNASWGTTNYLDESEAALRIMSEGWTAFNLYANDYNNTLAVGVELVIKGLPESTDYDLYVTFFNDQTPVGFYPICNLGDLSTSEWTTISFELPESIGAFTSIALGARDKIAGPYLLKDFCLVLDSILALPEYPKTTRNTNNSNNYLYSSGSNIYRNGYLWMGRGVNVMDTRSCHVCMWNDPNADEVLRRIDFAVNEMGANFIRLCLLADENVNGAVHYRSVLHDEDYLNDIYRIATEVNQKYDGSVQLLISLWADPSLGLNKVPTDQTAEVWRKISKKLAGVPSVLYGICNEPENNYDGSSSKHVRDMMQKCVNAIRYEEDIAVVPHHLVLVQGHSGWGRRVEYYTLNPIDDPNVAYEVHVYDTTPNWAVNLQPALDGQLPLVIGEFAPVDLEFATMTKEDCQKLVNFCNVYNIPFLGWTLHHKCPPNMLVAHEDGCGIGMTLETNEWGKDMEIFIKG